MRAWLKGFGCDTRSLGLARIAAGLVVLGDLLVRSLHFRAHYTAEGVLPAWGLFQTFGDIPFPIFHLVNDTAAFVLFCFLLQALAAIAVTLGFHTRWATVACWYLTTSLQLRNPLVDNGGDTLLRLILFWGIFIPWGERFSLDSLVARERKPRFILSWGTAALVGQVVILYVFAGLHKLHPNWIEEGSAVYYALNVDHLTTAHAQTLLHYPELLRFLSFAVVGFELFGGLLLLLPWTPLRLALVGGFVFMHFSFGLFLEISTFRYAPMVGLLALLPAPFWQPVPAFELPRRLKAQILTRLRKRRPPAPGPLGSLATASLVTLLCYVMLCNLESVTKQRLLADPIHFGGEALGLHQAWPMFTFLDKVKDGWYVMEAELEDGSVRDLLHGGPVDYRRPRVMSRAYDGQRWRRFMTNVMLRPHQNLLPVYADYMVRSWNRRYPRFQVKKLTIYFMNDPMHPHYRYAPPERWTLHVWEKSP